MVGPPSEREALCVFLLSAARRSQGLSGRALRKLPLQAHSMFVRGGARCSTTRFAEALLRAVAVEQAARVDLGGEEE